MNFNVLAYPIVSCLYSKALFDCDFLT